MSPWERGRLARIRRAAPVLLRTHPRRLRPRPGARAGRRLRAPLERRPPPRRRPRLEPGRVPRHHVLRDAEHRRDRGRRHAVLERLLGQPRLFADPGEPDDRQEPGAAADHRLHPRQSVPLRAAPAAGGGARAAARGSHNRRAHEVPGLCDRPLRQVAPQRGQGVQAGTADGPGVPGLRRHPRDRQAGVRGRPPGRRAPRARDHRAVPGVPRREPGPAVLPLRLAPRRPPSAAGRSGADRQVRGQARRRRPGEQPGHGRDDRDDGYRLRPRSSSASKNTGSAIARSSSSTPTTAASSSSRRRTPSAAARRCSGKAGSGCPWPSSGPVRGGARQRQR